MKRSVQKLGGLLLTLALVLTLVPSTFAAETASVMQLTKTEGSVSIENASGRSISVREKMRLYSGYAIKTETKSYAWIALDDTKLVKVDAASEVEVRKNGKSLELLVNSGNLLFNVTEPLEDDETLNICTATMVAGVRGTAGWVQQMEGGSGLGILEGKVACHSSGGDVLVESGQFTVFSDSGTVEPGAIDLTNVPGFVLTEAVANPALCAKILEKSGLNIAAITPEQAAAKQTADETAAEQAAAAVQQAAARQPGSVSQQSSSSSSSDSSSSSSSGSSGNSGNSKPNEPVTPSNPENPSDPSNPENPSDPSNPENPSDPSNPENPSDPSNPENPSDPSNPENPSDPSNPENPSDPSNPENPSDPSNPEEPESPAGLTVTGGTEGTHYTYSNSILTILTDQALSISSKGVTKDRIVVSEKANGANITLDNVQIDASGTNEAAILIPNGYKNDVTITLAGGSENVLIGGSGSAGLQKNNGGGLMTGTLTITGSGELEVRGGEGGAGIGGSSRLGSASHIKIKGGIINAVGGTDSTGIGGGSGTPGWGMDIEITGGVVTASGGDSGIPAIGSKTSANLTVNGDAYVELLTGKANSGLTVKQGIVLVRNEDETSKCEIAGNVTLNRDVVLTSDTTIPEDASLFIPSGVTLTIGENVTLLNNGAIELDGTIQLKDWANFMQGMSSSLTGDGEILSADGEPLPYSEPAPVMEEDIETPEEPEVPESPEASAEPEEDIADGESESETVPEIPTLPEAAIPSEPEIPEGLDSPETDGTEGEQSAEEEQV